MISMKWREALKNKKLVAAAALGLIVILAITAVLLLRHDSDSPAPDITGETSSTAVTPPTVSPGDVFATDAQTDSTAEEVESGLSDVHVELEEQTPENLDGSGETGDGERQKAEPAAQPVTPAEPPQDEEDAGGQDTEDGLQIGDAAEALESYTCGVEGHHCDGPETHAYLLNLELEGCPYCGSHACPSFYATDAWGGAITDVTQCPQYESSKDPIQYCQDCGKKNGDGTLGTCTQFISACECPLCGEHVEARTCHTCK